MMGAALPIYKKINRHEATHLLTEEEIDMSTSLSIRWGDLGVDHDGFTSGSSLDDLIECVLRQLAEQSMVSTSEFSTEHTRDLVRSVLVQTCRPAATRSVGLSSLVA